MSEKAFLLGINTKGLKYAITDVSLMQACLKQHGYETVIPRLNKASINKTSIIEQFDEFVDELDRSDTAIFYYSGHGHLLNGELQLVLSDNFSQSRQGYIGIDWFTKAFANCQAKYKLIILDCCNAGASVKEWRFEQSEHYRILTASERLEPTKELSELKAGFLTFYIYKGLTEHTQEIANQEGEIRLNEFYEWLKLQMYHHKNRELLRLPIPNLLGNQRADFLVAKLLTSLPVSPNNESQSTVDSLPYINLPHRDYPKFIGRRDELKELLKYISPDYRQHITIVEGIGGVGKTALVLEAAYRCWEATQKTKNHEPFRNNIPTFDAIIFTSAKQTYLTPLGEVKKPQAVTTLQDILQIIARTLDDPTITRAATEEQLELVYRRLSKQPTLLIVDNMETLGGKDKEEVLNFLANLPITTQAVITTREKVVMFKSIQLDSLQEKESLQLIAQQAKDKGIKLTPYQASLIYGRFGGIPVALIYAVGQRAMGYSLKRILNLSEPLPKDIAEFLFESSVAPLRHEAAHKLLMSLAIFQIAPDWSGLAEVAGLATDPIASEAGLAKLQQLSLVREQEGHYFMLSITREYALGELASYPQFEAEARERWVERYHQFTRRYGGKDWQDWRIRYDYLAKEWENIAAVLNWCATQDRYEDVKKLWQNVDNYVDLGGYWRTRRHWWRWLARESDRRADLSTYIKALAERGWTLTLMGGKEDRTEAAQALRRAWRMRDHAELVVQAEVAKYIAVHRKVHKKYHLSLKWLDRANTLLERAISEEHLEERDYARHQICIAYYRAEVYYRLKEYDAAKALFLWAIEQGERPNIRWQRFVNYAQNGLADILVKQGRLEEAENLLHKGFLVAERSGEKRRIAHYQATYANLEAERGNIVKARKLAEEALKVFNDKVMAEEMQEMQEMLHSLDLLE